MMKILKKAMAIMLAILLVLPARSMSYADEENLNEEVLNIAEEFLTNYWIPSNEIDYFDLENRFLDPSNNLFNKEIEARVNFSNLRVRVNKENGGNVIGHELHQSKDMTCEQDGNIYTVKANCEIIYLFKEEDSSISRISSELTDVILKFEKTNEGLKLIDLVDPISCYFNKDVGINGLTEEKEPYSVDPATDLQKDAQSLKSTKPATTEEDKELNIQKAEKILENRALMNLNSNYEEDLNDVEIMPYSSIRKLDRTK